MALRATPENDTGTSDVQLFNFRSGRPPVELRQGGGEWSINRARREEDPRCGLLNTPRAIEHAAADGANND
jgi:hypothetical protein